MGARAAGFSLIELLVVLVVIGLAIGMVSLTVNVGSEPQEVLEQEAQRLLEYSRLAADRAVMTGEPMGLLLLPPQASEAAAGWSWRWLRYQRGEWLEAEEPLTGRRLPEQLELSLQVEGQEVNLGLQAAAAAEERAGGRREEDAEAQGPEPSIVFYPGGEITPFQLTLFDAEQVELQRILTSMRRGTVESLDSDEAQLPPSFARP